MTLGELVETYLDSSAFRRLKPSSQKVYRIQLKKLAPLSGAKVSTLKRHDLYENWEKQSATMVGLRGAHRVARRLFNWAVERDLVETAPRLPYATGFGKSEPYNAWDSFEIVKYQEAADQYIALHPDRTMVRDAVDIALATGQRSSDIVEMRTSDWNGETFQLRQIKTGHVIKFKPSGRFKEILEQAKARRDKYVLYMPPPAHGRVARLRYHIDAVRERASIKKTIHGLRKTVAVTLREAGASNAQAAALLGHKTTRMIESYAREADQVVLASAAADLMARINED